MHLDILLLIPFLFLLLSSSRNVNLMAKEISLLMKWKENRKKEERRETKKQWASIYNNTSSAAYDKICQMAATLLENANYIGSNLHPHKLQFLTYLNKKN